MKSTIVMKSAKETTTMNEKIPALIDWIKHPGTYIDVFCSNTDCPRVITVKKTEINGLVVCSKSCGNIVKEELGGNSDE